GATGADARCGVLGYGDGSPEPHVESVASLLDRELFESAAIRLVAGGEHDVVERADAGEQVGDSRLVAHIECGAVARVREFGERGVDALLAAGGDGDNGTGFRGGLGRGQSHAGTAADDDDALTGECHWCYSSIRRADDSLGHHRST